MRSAGCVLGSAWKQKLFFESFVQATKWGRGLGKARLNLRGETSSKEMSEFPRVVGAVI